MSAVTARIRRPQGTLARSLGLVLFAGAVLLVASEALGAYDELQLANGAYYFAVLAGLTVLIGLSGQISLGHGALMAVGAYTVALLIGNEQWALVPALLAAVLVTTLVGVLVGAAATRLRGPYLAGATLAFAVGLPALADKYTSLLGGENGLVINPPTPPSGLGANFPSERWEAWIACAGALVVLFAMNNLVRSGVGRAFRAVRDDEIAASLCGLHVGRVQTVAFVVSAACAGLGGGLLAVVLQLAAPGAFALQLSLSLAHGGRPRWARLDRRCGLGRGGAGAAARLDKRHRPLVLPLDSGLGEPAAGDLRARPDPRDARSGRAASREPCGPSSREYASVTRQAREKPHRRQPPIDVTNRPRTAKTNSERF